MTTTQAARRLKVSERTIHRLIKRKSIKAERFGNYWAIDVGSLDRYKVSIAGKAKNDPTRGRGGDLLGTEQVAYE